MNTTPLKSKVTLLALMAAFASMLAFSGCAIVDQIKGDFMKSADNVTKKSEEVKKQIIQTRDSIDMKIQKAENVVNAVSDFQAEMKK